MAKHQVINNPTLEQIFKAEKWAEDEGNKIIDDEYMKENEKTI